jgi:hypothetical protein
MSSLKRSNLLKVAACIVAAPIAALSISNVHGAQSLPNPASIVAPKTYISLDKVPRGQTFEAAVVVGIAKGLHMNSNKPSEDYLIPTTITPNTTVAVPAGIRVVDTIYPPGQPKTFSFSPNKPLSVYSESATLRLKLTADAAAKLGATTLPMILRYQACNDSTCLPPVKVPVTVGFEVVPAGTAAHKAHGEIFGAAEKAN